MVLAPFLFGPGGALLAGSAISDPKKLQEIKRAILKRYLLDEAAEANGHLTKTEWRRKRQFLVNRYIDASRREDFLKYNPNTADHVGAKT
jgi:hypothetical protein